MTTGDIVSRLKSRAAPLTRAREMSPTAALCHEAAEEIERLRSIAQPSSGTERAAFIKAYWYLDLTEVPDAWGRPMFIHSQVQALWDGWFARACLHDPAKRRSLP